MGFTVERSIVDWLTKEEILKEFDNKGIKIPDPLMLEWDKLIQKKRKLEMIYTCQLEIKVYLSNISLIENNLLDYFLIYR
jgi:hypothetical protein